MFKKKTFTFLCFALSLTTFSQTILKATGSSNTYALLNEVLAPGYDAVEVPDCGHEDFGSHITEVFDADLNDYAFGFHMHVSEDNDRCKNFDRQRNEIKAYDKSPDNLLGLERETVIYEWKFKLDAGFQPSSSFTHLHQIKAVDGSEDSIPNITLTARKGTPDKLELRYAEALSQETLLKVDLDLLKGNWVKVVETITYGEAAAGGAYEIEITNDVTGAVILSYADTSLRMWKTDASFLRPKWGVYRSLNDVDSLRDEIVYFADFSIQEVNNALSISENTVVDKNRFYQDYLTKELIFTDELINDNEYFLVYNISGQLVLKTKLLTNKFDLSVLKAGVYIVKLSNSKEINDSLKIVVD